ncbi:hypothetical protein B0A55_04662 [Friedmanniomyces simplex]|uniref:Uncharacterized protein n=1 Tax=Friedmanniomyces simplex TaxID=329884 RepID=A0A4U0Y471_9PEZI|nr:hypothetical protein B0A55_04662 [Friedmanniomyces simplex]
MVAVQEDRTAALASKPSRLTLKVHKPVMADSLDSPPALLLLPRELQEQILFYLLRQGDRIPMEPETVSSKRLTLNREVELLNNPNWKPPKKKHFPAVLLVQPELYLSGVRTFWRGNTFVFGDCDELRSFMDVARPEAVSSITSIALGDDYHWEGKSGNMSDRVCRWHGIRNWSRPDWPPSLRILAKLPQLRRLEVYVGTLGTPSLIFAYGSKRNDPENAPMPCPLRLCDQLLLSIPRHVLDNLLALTLHYFIPYYTIGEDTAEVLQYVKDLHAGVLQDPPCPPTSTDSEQSWLYQRWSEPSTTMYWHGSVPQGEMARLKQLMSEVE